MLVLPHVGAWLSSHLQCALDWLQGLLSAHGVTKYNNAIALWLLFAACGVIELCISFTICTPIERLWPLTRWEKRNSIAADVLYAFFVRIVLFPLIAFFEYDWLYRHVVGTLSSIGFVQPSFSTLVPVLQAWPVITFALNFMMLDLADYWRHRLSHRLGWWYGIHSLHHAEDQMTFWSDDRSHILEDAITYVWLIAVGLIVGVPSFQFPFLILTFRLLGSVSHANTTIGYGWLGNHILISPRFHRTHHALKAAGRRSCNYGTALSLWDVVFGTARFKDDTVETGDAGAELALVHGSWIEQQRAGFRRMMRLARRKRDSAPTRSAA